MHRPLGIILMGHRVSEIDENAVSQVLGDKTVKFGYHIGTNLPICGDDLPHVLRVKPRR